ncbi:MFS_1 like family domain-containing protein [Phthorimaea operculella]|nr:MFS_1 like family domain-containing protein [Phthorimaea operculella]
MQFIKSFFKRITDDLKQKKLIPLKILFFVHASTLFVLYPYLTIHMRELGINVEETAIMSAVTPVVSIVMPPLAGMLADKIGNFRCLLALSSVLGGMSALLLLAVPVGRITVTFPPAVELLATCNGSSLTLRHVHDYPCAPLHPYSYDVNLTVLSCGFVCELPNDLPPEDAETIVHSHSYDVHLDSPRDSQHLVFRHTVSSAFTQTMAPKKDQSTSRIMTNDPNFNTTVSRISASEVFFPAPQLYQLECSRKSSNGSCLFGRADFMTHLEERGSETSYRVRISHDVTRTLADVDGYWVRAVAAANTSVYDDDYDGVDSVTCDDNFSSAGAKARVSANGLKLKRCSAACAGVVPRKQLCENQQQQIEIDPSLTFWAYLALKRCSAACAGVVMRKQLCENQQQQIEIDPSLTFWAYLAVSTTH